MRTDHPPAFASRSGSASSLAAAPSATSVFAGGAEARVRRSDRSDQGTRGGVRAREPKPTTTVHIGRVNLVIAAQPSDSAAAGQRRTTSGRGSNDARGSDGERSLRRHHLKGY